MLRVTTGNAIVDSIVGLLVAALVGSLFNARTSFADVFTGVYKWLFPTKASMVFSGRIYLSYSRHTSLTDRYIAVTDWLLRELTNNHFRDASTMREIQVPRTCIMLATGGRCRDSYESGVMNSMYKNGLLILDQHRSIDHVHFPITLQVTCRDRKEGGGDDGSGQRAESTTVQEYCDCTITISSKQMDLTTLHTFIHTNILDVFKKRAEDMNRGKLTYNIFTKRDPECGVLLFDKYPWTSTKQYEHVISEHTKHVEERITQFTNSRELYVKKGWCYSLSILLHGPPGCGKTSLIKAIANATKRHIIDISLPNVKDRRTLMDLFHDNGRAKPSETIFVIDDIDRMGDIVEKEAGEPRPSSEESESEVADLLSAANNGAASQNDDDDDAVSEDSAYVSKKTLKQLLKTLGVTSTGGKVSRAEEPPLIRSDLMNVLDGMLELNGVILIITANHPDRIDDAILRAGRINMKLCMGYASARSIQTMLRSHFPDDVARIDKADFRACAHRISPAQVEEMIQNSGSVDAVLDRLATWPGEMRDTSASPPTDFERVHADAN